MTQLTLVKVDAIIGLQADGRMANFVMSHIPSHVAIH